MPTHVSIWLAAVCLGVAVWWMQPATISDSTKLSECRSSLVQAQNAKQASDAQANRMADVARDQVSFQERAVKAMETCALACVDK